MIPTESWSGDNTWNVIPKSSGDILSITGIRTDFTYRERSPYAIRSLLSLHSLLSLGGASAWDICCASAAGTTPAANPIKAALSLRNFLRPDPSELIGTPLQQKWVGTNFWAVPIVRSIHPFGFHLKKSCGMCPRLFNRPSPSNKIRD